MVAPSTGDGSSAPPLGERDKQEIGPTQRIVSPGDIATLTRLGADYRRNVEAKQLEILATFQSTRQTARASVLYLVTLFIAGTAFVKVKTEAPLSQAILFSVYTFTSAGFGNVDIPEHSNTFLAFVIFYMFAGISGLAVLVAQTFQYLELKASRSRYARDKAAFAADGERKLRALLERSAASLQQDEEAPTPPASSLVVGETTMDRRIREGLILSLRLVPQANSNGSKGIRFLSSSSMSGRWDMQRFMSRCGSIASAVEAPVFLIVLLLIGTIAMMSLEGWSFVEALYFSSFAMTSVGYGDLAPTTEASTWFVNFWLPMNVPFLAVFLGSVAHYYVQFSNWNIGRIENQIKQKMDNTKRKNIDTGKGIGPTDHEVESAGENDADATGDDDDAVATGEIDADADNSSPEETQEVRMEVSVMTPSSSEAYSTKHSAGNGSNDDCVEAQVISSESQMQAGYTAQEKGSSDANLKEEEETSIQNITKTDNDAQFANEEDNKDLSFAVPEILTLFNSSQHTQYVGHHERRKRIRQFSAWSLEERDFFGKEEALLDENPLEESSKIISTRDLLVGLNLTKATGAALLASKEGGDESQIERGDGSQLDPSLLNTRIQFKTLERLARIVASEATNRHAEVEVNGNILAVTMDYLKDIAERWMIPNRAREAFRSVAFAGLTFVGEREILLRGVEAFFSLNPLQFHSVFSPFLVAMEDTDTMVAWLVNTQSMRDALKEEPFVRNTAQINELLLERRKRRVLKNKIEAYFSPNPGNAVRMQM